MTMRKRNFRPQRHIDEQIQRKAFELMLPPQIRDEEPVLFAILGDGRVLPVGAGYRLPEGYRIMRPDRKTFMTPCPWCALTTFGARETLLEVDAETQAEPDLLGLHCNNCHMPSDWDPLLRVAIIPAEYDGDFS